MSKRSRDEVAAEIIGSLRRTQAMQDLFDEVAAERLGVHRTDLRLLDMLDTDGPLTAGRLAELNRLSKPATTAAIDRLERAGYAKRTRDSEDRRQVIVAVTPKLRRKASAIWGPMATAADDVFERFSLEELEVVARFSAATLDLFPAQIDRLKGSPRR